MQNEMINSLVYIGVPIDAMIVSGLTDKKAVEISATHGRIIIEAIEENCEECLCDECRAKLGLDETEVEE